MGAFWQNGYKATPVNDIVRESGLNTASLYKEFGDKDGLFPEVLDYYRGHVICPRCQILKDTPNMAGVETFRQNVILGCREVGIQGLPDDEPPGTEACHWRRRCGKDRCVLRRAGIAGRKSLEKCSVGWGHRPAQGPRVACQLCYFLVMPPCCTSGTEKLKSVLQGFTIRPCTPFATRNICFEYLFKISKWKF